MTSFTERRVEEFREATPDIRSHILTEFIAAALGADNLTKRIRIQRFLEEATELAQASDLDEETVHKLVSYVYSRPKGLISQEIGGVMVTLAVLCEAAGNSFDLQFQTEGIRLLRMDTNKLRERNKAKEDAGFGQFAQQKPLTFNVPELAEHPIEPSFDMTKPHKGAIDNWWIVIKSSGERRVWGHFQGQSEDTVGWTSAVVKLVEHGPGGDGEVETANSRYSLVGPRHADVGGPDPAEEDLPKALEPCDVCGGISKHFSYCRHHPDYIPF